MLKKGKMHQLKTIATALVIAIALCITLRLTAFVSPFFIEYQPSFPYYQLLANSGLPQWVYSFAGFDGVHYLVIATNGYHLAYMTQAFFPVWPVWLSFGVFLGIEPILFGLATNTFLFAIMLLLWRALLRAIYPNVSVVKSTLLLILFPFSFFFFALYSEVLFLVLVLATMLSAHKKYWKLAVLFAALASGTRIVGVVLVPTILIEYWWQHLEVSHTRKLTRQSIVSALHPKQILNFVTNNFKMIGGISLGASGLLIYMAYLGLEFGDPLLFRTVQSEWGHDRSSSFILYPQVVWRYLHMLTTSFELTVGWYSILQEFMVGVMSPFLLGLAALFYTQNWFYTKVRLATTTSAHSFLQNDAITRLIDVCRMVRIRPSHLFFGLAVLLIPISTGTFSSIGRYSLAAFPFFIALSLLLDGIESKMRWLPKHALTSIWLLLSTFLLICNTILFIQGYWIA